MQLLYDGNDKGDIKLKDGHDFSFNNDVINGYEFKKPLSMNTMIICSELSYSKLPPISAYYCHELHELMVYL